MGLKDLTLSLPRKEVQLADGQSFSVRGLSLSDISTLVAFHGERLKQIYAQLVSEDQAGNLAIAAETIGDVAQEVVIAAPGIAAHIIALASRETPDEVPAFDVAAMLPIDVQVDALDKTIRLTFQTEGGAKKVWETVTRLLGGLSSKLAPKG